MRHLAWLFPLLLVSSAHACINDRDSDTLANQAKKLPDTLRVITGRFERNPPLYYQMRIRRSLEQLKQNPRQYGLYDDIGAAYDRLHQSDKALQIMGKKRALLPPYNAKKPDVKEAWYRYYANTGTFRAHRWLSAGAKPKTISEMKQARSYIKRALEIKPNAHFGREKYQLMTMDWILATKERAAKTQKTLGDWLSGRDQWDSGYGASDVKRRRQATEGLAGLVVLGAAWQSPDVFEALAASLADREGVTLRYLALLRCRELLFSGKASVNPTQVNTAFIDTALKEQVDPDGMPTTINPTNQKTLNELFPKLRSEADTWAGKRNAYMLARLEKGAHPDTNPQFWNNWKPSSPPSLDVRWFDRASNRYLNEPSSVFFRPLSLLILAGTLLGSFLALRFMSRRATRARKFV